MNDAAIQYVRLVLAMGEHDADYVDAYYGPAAWRDEVRAARPSLSEIQESAGILREQFVAMESSPRRDYLLRQTEALIARAEMLQGRRFTFDEESKALYDAVAPAHDEDYFRALNAAIDLELPGSESLASRVEDFRAQFVIPRDKLDVVFKAAIDVCRAKTMAQMPLPPGETFTVEYVNGKSWSGYNWYQGDFRSLIQVNTDLPIFIDRAIDLACHEGYPGHHVYNALLEQTLVCDRGWVEFSVYALFSAQSLIAEGSANYGITMAFPGEERVDFERATLFPLAGLDPVRAAEYYRVQELVSRLSHAGNEAARRYLDGEIAAPAAIDWLTRYALMSPESAAQRIRFFDTYRSYVINYNLGQDIVRDHVGREAGAGASAEARWRVFESLLSTPRLPSGLR